MPLQNTQLFSGPNGIAYAAVYSKNGEYVNCTNWVTLKRTPGFLLDAAIQNGYEKEGAVTWTHATRQPYMLLSRNVRPDPEHVFGAFGKYGDRPGPWNR